MGDNTTYTLEELERILGVKILVSMQDNHGFRGIHLAEGAQTKLDIRVTMEGVVRR